jgi:hypothetical protein
MVEIKDSHNSVAMRHLFTITISVAYFLSTQHGLDQSVHNILCATYIAEKR